MAFVGGLFSNDNGAGFKAQDATVVNPLAGTASQQANVNNSTQQLQQFVQALQGANGVGNQSDVYNQLGQIAQGQGPNPAQAMLNNATGQNIANQAALAAGQRGASVNPALIARMAGQQGGALQQQAVGQGAAMQANQSLNALGQQGQIAGNQINQQGSALGQLGSMTANNLNTQIGANNALNQANLGNISQQNQNNTTIASGNQKAQTGLVGNITGGVGSALGLAHGGEVPTTGPRSSYGKMVFAKGGAVPALVSPGEVYLPPKKVEQVAKGQASPMSGEKIKGKPAVGGAVNSYANDTVKKTLQAGGIVIPRSITQRKDAPEAAKKFVEAMMAKKRSKK